MPRYLVILVLLLPVAAHAADRLPNGDTAVNGYHCETIYRHLETPRQRIIRDSCGIKDYLRQLSPKDRAANDRISHSYGGERK